MPVRGVDIADLLLLRSLRSGHLFKFSQDGPPHAIHSAIQQA